MDYTCHMDEFLRTLSDSYLWIIIAILALNLLQGKLCTRSANKRKATLVIATFAIIFQIVLVLVVTKGKNPIWLFAALLAIAVLAVVYRKQVWPFRAHCTKCHKILAFKTIIADDENLCPSCLKAKYPKEEAESANDQTPNPWDNWEPDMVFSDCYILDGKGNVLLIERKEKGFGFGRVCAPGGQMEAGETATECAIREVLEEVGLEIKDPKHMGYVNFMIPGNNLRGHIYIATKYSGKLIESDEARPFWCNISEIPFDRMFDDASIWLKAALDNRKFDFYGVCDTSGKLISHEFILEHNSTLKADV